MDLLKRFVLLTIFAGLSACGPDDTHRMWDCWCDAQAEGYSGTLNFPMWCDDTHDRTDNGALMVTYCHTYMSLWWDPDEFVCACDCRELVATTAECTGGSP